MDTDGPADIKTRERTEGATTAVQAMHGDSCSANRVDPDPMCSTSFGDDCTGPPALPCSKEDALVDNGAAAPKSCLSPLEMSTSAADGLLPTGKASTATKTTFDELTLWFCETEETHSERTSTPSAWYDSSFQRNKLLGAPSCRRVVQTKSGKNWMFDPGDSQGLLLFSAPACFWERGARCFMVRLCVLERLVAICSILGGIDHSGFLNLQEWCGRNIYAIRIAVNRWFFTARPALNMSCQNKGMPSRAARGRRS